jgi:hypothetical protein
LNALLNALSEATADIPPNSKDFQLKAEEPALTDAQLGAKLQR